MTTFSHPRMSACHLHGIYIWSTPGDPCPKCVPMETSAEVQEVGSMPYHIMVLQNNIIGGLHHFNSTGLKRILSFMDYLAAHERNRKLS